MSRSSLLEALELVTKSGPRTSILSPNTLEFTLEEIPLLSYPSASLLCVTTSTLVNLLSATTTKNCANLKNAREAKMSQKMMTSA
jgi:hypothetical protein